MMPDRIIRDELLDSERYIALSSDTARMLFVHLLLVADDLGNVDLATPFVRRRLLFSHANDESTAKLCTELADADLIRLYMVDGKRYAHIPRFRQRLRYYNSKRPRPPMQIESLEIKDMLEKRRTMDSLQSDLGPTQDRLKSAEVKRSEGREGREGREELPSNADALLVGTDPDPDLQGGEDQDEERTALACPHQKIIALYAKHLPGLTQPRTWEGTRAQTLTVRWRYCAKINGASPGYQTQAEGLTFWGKYFAYVATTKLAEGFRRPDGSFWQPDLPWLLKAENFAKIVEGKYS